jgi:hypothetical protein
VIETVSETEVVERPAESTSDNDDDDTLFHYVIKSRIVESAVTGKRVRAICGAKFSVTRTPTPGSPVCPKCRKIYGRL